MPSSLSAHPPLSIPALDPFQLQLTPFNSTPISSLVWTLDPKASAAVYASDASFAERLAAATDDLKRVTLVSEMTAVTDEAEISNACGGDGVGAVTELDVTALESDRSTAGAAEVIRGGAEGSGRVVVGVRRATGTKCARCWEYTTDAGSDERHPELCARCTPIVIAIDPELRAPVKAAEGVAA